MQRSFPRGRNNMSEHMTYFGKQGPTKVEAMGWRALDKPGGFEWVMKGQLGVDHTYQRDRIREHTVNQIAREWSWMKLGVLLVVRRPDGTLWVYDGQHRKLAADKRADVEALPCMIFQAEAVTQEADAFIGANTVRGTVTSWQRFKAQVVARDPVALAVKETVEASGYRVSEGGNGDGVVTCVSTLVTAFESDPRRAASIWGVCVGLYKPAAIPFEVFSGLFYLDGFLKARQAGEVTDPGIVEKLQQTGTAELENKIRAAVIYRNKGGIKVYAQGILNALNHKRRNRLPNILDGDA